MMMRIERYFDLTTEIAEIRREVFMEEQGISFVDEFEGGENTFVHFCLYCSNHLIGYARAISESADLHIGRVAVRKMWRKQGYGYILMKAAEEYGRENGCKTASLNAQIQAMGFYVQLGYNEVGDAFIEAGIEHKCMIKVL